MSGAADVLAFVRERLPGGGGEPRIVALAGDGSGRRYFRIDGADERLVAILNPLEEGRAHPDENEGFLAVRSFLAARGVRVPDIFDADLPRGLILIEDLGDERLCDRVAHEGWERWPAGSLPALYEDAIRALALMHAPADPSFDPAVAPNPPYTEAFIIEWEADYFHRELVRGWLGLEHPFEEIESDCIRLALDALSARRAQGPPPVSMHRDYQSRNLMIVDEGIAVIDFQGARDGPPEYDLAALLYDPYVSMPENARRDLASIYVREASRAGVPGIQRGADKSGSWRRLFLANAANRLMQALGAYGKLGGRFKRPGFLEYVPAALAHLEAVLEERADAPSLLALVRELRSRALPPA